MPLNGRTLVESQTFTTQFKTLGDNAIMSPALRGIFTMISNVPEEFPVVAQANGRAIYVAKTKSVDAIGGVSISALRIFFHLIDAERIELLHFEVMEQEDITES